MASKITKVELEFVFKAALADRIPLRIHNRNTHARCLIAEIGRESVAMEAVQGAWPGFQSWDRVTGYIHYKGQAFSFKSRVSKVDGKLLVMGTPEFSCRGLDRNYVRLPPPSGLSAAFHLQSGELSLNFPVCEEYSAVELPAYNDAFDVTSMETLVASFKRQADAVSSENRTIMFRKRKPERFEEILVSKLGKTLYIPSARSGLPAKDPFPEGRLITRAMEEDYEGTEIFISGSRMERLLAEKVNLAVNSEIWTPILYYQYVVGYVYMANTGDRKASLDVAAVELAGEFAHILAYFLKTHNYFDDQTVRNERIPFQADIVDVSASGMLIVLAHEKLPVTLKNQSLIDVELGLKGYKAHCTARVMRRYGDDKTVNYGLRFDDMRNDTRRRIYEFLYHQPWDPDRQDTGEASFGSDDELPEMPS